MNPFGNTLNELTGDALSVMMTVFDPAYMGAAEFEWGALPKSLERMYENESIIMAKTNLIVQGDGYSSLWHEVYYVGDERTIDIGISNMHSVYLQGSKGEEVTKADYGSLYATANKLNGYDKLLKGWFDLNNDFAVFLTDGGGKRMARHFKAAITPGGFQKLNVERTKDERIKTSS